MPTTLIDERGWLKTAFHCPSTHFDLRPQVTDISLLVLHNLSLPPRHFGHYYAEKLFLGQLAAYREHHEFFAAIADLKVSSHFFITRNGAIIQYVSALHRAWHAGISSYCERQNCNDYSIGIELSGADDIPYTLRQYQALTELSCIIMRTYPQITPARIVTHQQIAPQRKTDPGSAFNHNYFHHCLAENALII